MNLTVMDTIDTLTACGLDRGLDVHELADDLGNPVAMLYD